MTDDQKLLDELGRKPLSYARHRFLWTWLALGGLAILTCFALISASRNAKTDLQQTDDIARVAQETAAGAQKSSDQTVAYLRGDQGIPGVPGANGQDGSPGQPSSQPGPPGPAGAKGDTGAAGAPGSAGLAGAQGAAGAIGPVGPVGMPGNPGETGQAGQGGQDGAQGQRGPEGPRGEAGPQGPAGPAGPAGPQGPAGDPHTIDTSIAVAQSANDTQTHKVATATCSTGKVSGGGFAIVPSDPGLDVTASSPAGNGWSATVDQLSLPPGTNWQVLVFAVCVQ